MTRARYAVYLYPRSHPELLRLANAWLGRDPESGEALPQPRLEGWERSEIRRITESPRRYGFHATLKAPFRLAPGKAPDDLVAVLGEFAARHAPFRCPPLRLATLADFIALRPAAECPELHALAEDCVEAFESCRAPLDPADLRRWQECGLAPELLRNLAERGYPWVGRWYRPHFTLTGPLTVRERQLLMNPLARLFAPALEGTLRVESVSLYRQPGEGGPFRLIGEFPLNPAPSGR